MFAEGVWTPSSSALSAYKYSATVHLVGVMEWFPTDQLSQLLLTGFPLPLVPWPCNVLTRV